MKKGLSSDELFGERSQDFVVGSLESDPVAPRFIRIVRGKRCYGVVKRSDLRQLVNNERSSVPVFQEPQFV